MLDCLKETCDFLSPTASKKSQKILVARFMSDPLVHVPKLKLQDIFYNVIANAIKFSPAGSSILIDATGLKDFFEIRIKDQGSGLRPEDFPA